MQLKSSAKKPQIRKKNSNERNKKIFLQVDYELGKGEDKEEENEEQISNSNFDVRKRRPAAV